jgi:16S rRNA (guanine527-N7)-methyltransferase
MILLPPDAPVAVQKTPQAQYMRSVSHETEPLLRQYATLLLHWNQRQNLIGRSTEAEVWERHILESAIFATYLPDRAARIADLGSGAGLPGMVLALLGYQDVHLIESDSRKCAFLQQVRIATGQPVTIHNARIETLQDLQADIVTARACAPLPQLLGYAATVAKPGARLLLAKGARWETELAAARKQWTFTCAVHKVSPTHGAVILDIGDLQRVSVC